MIKMDAAIAERDAALARVNELETVVRLLAKTLAEHLRVESEAGS